MTTATNDSLAKAVAYLGAVEVAPGRIAVRGRGRFIVFSQLDIPKLAAYCERDLSRMNEDCAEVYLTAYDGTAMPSKASHGWDWTPGHRFAMRCKVCGDVCCDTAAEQMHYLSHGKASELQRITADLEIGQEVAA